MVRNQRADEIQHVQLQNLDILRGKKESRTHTGSAQTTAGPELGPVFHVHQSTSSALGGSSQESKSSTRNLQEANKDLRAWQGKHHKPCPPSSQNIWPHLEMDAGLDVKPV